MFITGFTAFSKSSHNDITKLYDSSGNACGFDTAKEYPFLLMQSFSKPYKSICVKSCPVFDYNEIMHGKGVKPPMYFAEFKKMAGLSHTKNKKFKEDEAFAYDEGFANGHYTKE